MSTTVGTPLTQNKTMVLNMGPQHPSTHGVLRVILELDGEIVLKAEPVIGYLHTGIEKNCENLTYSQCIPLTDRIDYLANLSNNLGYCLAVEKLADIQVPKRAQYIRVLL
ncbi:MAG: NADH-quinone oxidoreductase subunit D, partial [Candidatus Acidiferrales bacterium]